MVKYTVSTSEEWSTAQVGQDLDDAAINDKNLVTFTVDQFCEFDHRYYVEGFDYIQS